MLKLNPLDLEWEMGNAEMIAINYLLEKIKPQFAIEIGTKCGGSLQILSKHSQKVFSLDIDPNILELKDQFNNVDFIIGDSKVTLPDLLKDIKSNSFNLSFILVDGDHSYDGVKADIENILKFVPEYPLYILMHDSFNPNCREGIKAADWESNPYISSVEIDFIHGRFNNDNQTIGQMWGGFALAVMNPARRTNKLKISEISKNIYDKTLSLSKHNYMLNKNIVNRIKNNILRKLIY